MSRDYLIPLGQAKVQRVGTDVTIVAFSRLVGVSLEVAEKLKKEHGVSVEVLNLRTIRPLDWETIIKSVKKTNRVVCVEEGWPQSGVTAELCSGIIERA